MSSEEIKNARGKAAAVIKTVCSVAWWCALILLGILTASIIGAKMQGKVPNVFGYSVMNIITGSMGEEMPVGSYILIKKVPPEQIKENDIICFYSTAPEIYGMPNTHRVVEPPILKDGKYEFVTKGDAAADNDPQKAQGEMLIGVYVQRMHWLEDFSSFLDGGGMIWLIILLQLGIGSMIVITAIKKGSGDSSEE